MILGVFMGGNELNIKKVIGVLLFVNLMQIILVLGMWINKGEGAWKNVGFSLYLVVGLALINSLATVVGVLYANRLRNEDLLESMKNLEELNTTLRVQRHDYLNHLQVVYGLIELEEYEEAKRYMEPVFNEVIKVSRALKTAQPAINALLQAKLEVAEKNKVHMTLNIKTDLRHLKIEPWELCKVLANIIDNGITALLLKTCERHLIVDINEEGECYLFNICNDGPVIDNNQLEQIFKQGYTTKKEVGHGMGLYIVKKIIGASGGTIHVTSTEEKTSFQIQLPKEVNS